MAARCRSRRTWTSWPACPTSRSSPPGWARTSTSSAIVAERIQRYIDAVAETETVGEDVRRGVLYAASRVPVLIVSGAAHAEIEGVLAAAGLPTP